MGDALLGMAAIDTYLTTFRGRDIVVLHTSHLLIREHWRGRNLVQKLGARTFLASPPAISAAAYLLVLRCAELQELPAAAAKLSHLLATFRFAHSGTAGGAHRPACNTGVRTRVATRARRGGSVRNEASAANHRATDPRFGQRTGAGLFRPRQPWSRLRRHAGLPVPADSIELAQPCPESLPAFPTPPRDTLTPPLH